MSDAERENMITKRSLLDLYNELEVCYSELEARVRVLERENATKNIALKPIKQPRTKDGKFAKKK